MRKDFGAKPWTYPQPVFILGTYGADGTPNAMNAAWGGLSDEHELTLCISASHKTTENFLARGAFTLSMADVEHLAACDYVGMVSGSKVPDKVERCGLHAVKAAHVDAPLFEELAMGLECHVVSYDRETCRLVAEIVNISADERVLNEAGKIDPAKLRPITFDPVNNAYLALGGKVGSAFHDGAQLM